MSENSVLKAEVGKGKERSLLPLLLIVVGFVLLVTNVLNIRLFGLLWPALIAAFGLLMLWPSYRSTAEEQSPFSILAIPGAMTLAGGAMLVLMNVFGHYASMFYAWTLILAAGAAGYLYQRRFIESDSTADKARRFIRVMVLAFMGLTAFFELLIFQTLGGWWPLLVVGLGLYLWIKEYRSNDDE